MIYKFFIISFHAPHEFSQNLNWVTDGGSAEEEKLPSLRKKVGEAGSESAVFICRSCIPITPPEQVLLFRAAGRNHKMGNYSIPTVALLCNTVTHALHMNIHCSILCSFLLR